MVGGLAGFACAEVASTVPSGVFAAIEMVAGRTKVTEVLLPES